jgi:hypothetical protein
MAPNALRDDGTPVLATTSEPRRTMRGSSISAVRIG